ncbi:YceI family protein [Pollutimonas subterranea]|nr:YceI family protein [Pollutimonas subterranea]
MHAFPSKTAIAMAVAIAATHSGMASATPVRYDIEPTHTFVNFEVRHFNTSTVRARFDKVDGFVELDRQAGKGKAEINIDTGSVSSGVPDFDGHLKSADFFNVSSFPQARFVGADFRYNGDKLESVTGELTMLGKTAPVTLTASSFNCYDQPVLKVHVCGGDFSTDIKRSEWGMNWGIDMGVPDSVRLLVQIEAIQK